MSGDLTWMSAAEPAFGAQQGMTLMHVHDRSKCEGRGIPCCTHEPSEHHMKSWPMNWRSGTGVMERTCPHGVGHPDPDHMAYVDSLTPLLHDCPDDPCDPAWSMTSEVRCQYPHLEWHSVHGCCPGRCCVPPVQTTRAGEAGTGSKERHTANMTNPARVETPIVPAGQPKEPVLLLDTSGSMLWEAAEGSSITRWDVVSEALPLFVAALEGQDSQAATEQAGGSDEMGGLLVHGFSNFHTEHGDFNSSNFAAKWATVKPGGGTTIMPAWKAAQEDYMEEFGDADAMDRPALLCLVITDGEATDAAEFASVLSGAKQGRYFAVAIVGHGDEHDKTLRSYQGAAQVNPKHVAVLSFDSVTDPKELAADLITLAGLGQ